MGSYGGMMPGASSSGWGLLPAQADPELEACRLRSLEDLPAAFRGVYNGSFRYFNAIQSEVFQDVAQSPVNVVLAAPTGSGKTVVLELAVLQLLSQHIDQAGAFHHKPGCLKIVYLAPVRALVQEKVREWSDRFGKALGLTCKEVTGDTDISDLDSLDAVDIITTTAEKFDSLTRRHRNKGSMRFFNEIALVLVDEVHLLNENRGSSLEAGVISRIKMVSGLREMREMPIGRVRFVAVSATIPNIQDIADWLGVPPQGVKVFGEEMRPVKLKTVVRGYNPTKTDFLFERRLNDHISAVVADFSKGRPALVFCSSRKGTSETAQQLVKEAVQRATGGRPSIYIRDVAHNQRLEQAVAQVKDGQLKECIKAGVGFHHAAMEPAERAVVEQLFLNLDILVLCTTSTLAMGVNLPAHLVVIKGTRRYIGSEADDPSGYQEYERSTVTQMVGRAGRPQFDTEGVAVIMTQKQQVPRYEQLVAGQETVESSLKDMLPEFLNAEIVLRTITDVSVAIKWLQSTFFYTRVKRNPAHYGVPRHVLQSQEALDRWVKERLVLGPIQELAKHGLVRTDEDGFALEPLQPGVIMAERYIRLKTMVSLCSSPLKATIPDLINIIAVSAELSNIKLRRSEKKTLNAINHSDGVRYHVMNPTKPNKIVERINAGEHKVFILVNAALGDQPVDKLEYSLRQEMDQIVSAGARIASAMIKYFQHKERASEAFNAFLLHKNLKQKMWTDSMYETRQLPGIGPLISERLAAAGIHKLQQLAEVDPRRLETISQRHYPFGNEVHSALKARMPPALELQIAPAGRNNNAVELEVTVSRAEGTGNPDVKSRACLLVGTLGDNKLLSCRQLCLETFPSPLTLRVKASMPRGTVAPLSVVATVVHEWLVGVDVAIKVDIPVGAKLPMQPQLQRAEGASIPTPNPTHSEAQAAASSMELPDASSNEQEEGAALCAPGGGEAGVLPAAATTLAAATAAAAPAAAGGMPALGTAGQPKPVSEARLFMNLQQTLRQHRPKVLGPAAASAGPAGRMEHAAIGAPHTVPASGGLASGMPARAAVPAVSTAMQRQSGIACMQPAIPAPTLPLPAGSQVLQNAQLLGGLPNRQQAAAAPQPTAPPKVPPPTSSQTPGQGGAAATVQQAGQGSSKWTGFIQPKDVSGTSAQAAKKKSVPAAGMWGSSATMPAAYGRFLPKAAMASANPHHTAQQVQLAPSDATLQGSIPTAALWGQQPQQSQLEQGHQEQLQQLQEEQQQDMVCVKPGQLFSQFRCKPGPSVKPAPLLLSKLSAEKPAASTQQQPPPLHPSAAAAAPARQPFAQAEPAGQQQQPLPLHTSVSAAPARQPFGLAAVAAEQQAPVPPPAGPAVAGAGVLQKRKHAEANPSQRENQLPASTASAAPAGNTSAGAVGAAEEQPTKRGGFKLPNLPFMSRWRSQGVGAGAPLASTAAAGVSTGEAAVQVDALPDAMDCSQCFAFL